MKSPAPKALLWKVLSLVLALLVVILGLRKPQEKVVERIVQVPIDRIVEKEVEKVVTIEVEREVEPDPESVLGISSDTDLVKTSRGFSLSSKFNIENGGLATVERKKKSAYRAEYTLTVRVPRAAATIGELTSSTPGLDRILPGLPTMLETAVVSDFFEKIYQNKTERLRNDATKLGSLLTSHNFFDCQTILNLKAPTGRKVFLLQGDMDVVSDGSDGDRLATMPDEVVNSSYYQPTTSYGWSKLTSVPNPMIAGYQRRLAAAQAELRSSSVSQDRKDWVRRRIKDVLQPGIDEMKRRSFLVADYDPFIVIPMNIIVDRRDPWGPKVGDYAVVVYNGIIYPAIVGDAGPTFKVGEASLRMARQIDKKAGPYLRPVSSLSVIYLCFPGTAEKPHRPPDYRFWRSRCQELLGEMGGLGNGLELFTWEDTFPKPPEPEPAAETVPTPEGATATPQ